MKKDHYLNLFKYLLEFSKLRTNVVNDIRDNSGRYLNVLWFSDFQPTKRIDAANFSGFDSTNEYWLEVKRPALEPVKPKFPEIPKVLEEWIEEDTLIDEADGPKLKEKIPKNDSWIYPSEVPNLENIFNEFVEKQWFENYTVYVMNCQGYLVEVENHKKEVVLYSELFGRTGC